MYRLKETVEAYQLTNNVKSLEVIQNNIEREVNARFLDGNITLSVDLSTDETERETVVVSKGDWLIKTSKGLIVLSDKEFNEKYEKVFKRKSRAKANGGK